MSDCTVCGLPAGPLVDIGGRDRGFACSTECAAMIFFRWPPEQRAYEAWEWRRRRADVRGEPFTEPSPMDQSDREWLALLAANPKLKGAA